MIRAACTIVSLNYLPYARTLCDSFLEFHPECKFYVLLVDRLPSDFDASKEPFDLVLVEELGFNDFEAIAFKYDILEMNTNVKPSFLKRILASGVDQVVYFDPDILICSRITPVFEALETHGIILTPHCTVPNDNDLQAETFLLRSGVFNLGFIAVSGSDETTRFLSWWEHRCLTLGYDERWSGLFVDQKWVNLAPCYFRSVLVLPHPGCNVAYWNLHERELEKLGSFWMVNKATPLIFFHFSGIAVDGGDRISKHTDIHDLINRPELRDLFEDYRARLIQNGIRHFRGFRYAFGTFDNGVLVNKIQRAAFAANLERFGAEDPFKSSGRFYDWARKRHLQSDLESVGRYGRRTYVESDKRVRAVNAFFRFSLRILGADRYTILMKFLEYVSILRNQKEIFDHARES